MKDVQDDMIPAEPLAEKTMEQRILDAAEGLFLDRGFALASTTDIAREAGCNQALVHYYFRSKENLFVKVFEQKIRLFMTAMIGIEQSDRPFAERLRGMVEAHFDIIAANPKLPFLIINELTVNPARIEGIKRGLGAQAGGLFRRIDSELQAEVARGTIRPTTAVDLLITVVSLNAFLFLAAPILRTALAIDDAAFDALIARRRDEVARVVLSSVMI